jgi:copper chaperone CopZ
MKKLKFKVEGMHCTSCALLIDEELEETKGIRQSRTNYARQVAEVEFDEQQVDEEKIQAIIAQIGYKAQAIKP